ncbi:MAG: hypothetical protein V1743_00395 [Nanoarchaeota archaeon]
MNAQTSCFTALCKKKPALTLSYNRRGYCSSCYLSMIEARIRKALRTTSPIDVKRTFRMLNDDSPEYHVARHFLDRIFGEHLKLKVVSCLPTNKDKKKQELLHTLKKDEQLILATSMDAALASDFEKFIRNVRGVKKDKRIISILDNVLDEELAWLARLLKINKNSVQHKNPLIESIEKKHPGSKFCLKKSLAYIQVVESR